MSAPPHATPASSRFARVREAVERARRSEFYARHLDGVSCVSPDDLSRLPLTHKDDLGAASPFGMLAVPPAEAWHYHESSGTTGTPISTWCGLEELGAMADAIRAYVPEFAAPNAMLLNRFPSFAPVHHLMEEVLRRTRRNHVAAGSMSWDVPFGRVVDFLQRLPVTMLGTLPLETVLLREAATSVGLDLKTICPELDVVLLGGAALPGAMRRNVEADWNARVVEIYGSNETMLLGIGCRHGALHLMTDLLEMELLDPSTEAPVPPGTPGVLTVTSLAHAVMPLVRYVTGDLVEIFQEPCPCGAPTPTARVLGRAAEVVTYGATTITPYRLLDACYDFVAAVGARVFFVVLLRRGIEVLVELPAGRSATAASEENRLAANLGVPVQVQYLAEGDVLDRSALFRTPKIYKPSQVSDWRGSARKTITLMEALLEWPKFDLRTLAGLVRREIKNARRRKRLTASDR